MEGYKVAGRVQRCEERYTEHVIMSAKYRVRFYPPQSITAILCAAKAKDWSRDRHSTKRQPSVNWAATH